MAPVYGFAITRLFLSQLTGFTIATCAVVLAPCDGVTAVSTYDRAFLLYIKDSIERRFNDWDSYKQTFPPPIVCLPASPAYVLLYRDLCN